MNLLLARLIANPDLALISILLGILLLYAEFNRPGTVLFACLGITATTLGVYALAQHPIKLEPLVYIAFGIAIVVSSIVYPSRRLQWVQLAMAGIKNSHMSLVPPSRVTPKNIFMAFTGAVALAGGLILLLPTNPRIHLTTALLVSLTFSTVTIWLGGIALQARRNKRLPNPTPHSAAPARTGTARRVD